MTRPKVSPFVSLISPRDSERRLLRAMPRDGLAYLAIAAPLLCDGFELGPSLVNYPPERGQGNGALLPIQVPAGPGDLILTSGRLPTHLDAEQEERKPLRSAYTDLEHRLGALWRSYFTLLTRSYAVPSPRLKDALPSAFANRAHIVFYQAEGARYRLLGRRPYRGEPRTAVFVLRERELWPGGPGYLGTFGMDGTSNLIWAHLLRERHPELLRADGFVMAELYAPKIPARPTDLGFALDWRAEVIAQIPN